MPRGEGGRPSQSVTEQAGRQQAVLNLSSGLMPWHPVQAAHSFIDLWHQLPLSLCMLMITKIL